MQLSKSYQLIRKLASGGMAEVFLARTQGPRGFSKTLVLKRILPHLAGDEQFVEMFLGEARLVAQINHPNVVQIFDFGEFEDSYYIAMEYIDGPNLRTLMRRAHGAKLALAPALCARIAAAACEGLAHAHELADPETQQPLGLVHRDVSPDNILIARNGTVKVVDFGIAKALGQQHRTKAGTIKGKLPYMPPEQMRGRPLDRRVDVFALGVVLYELLTFKRPFGSGSETELMEAVLHKPMRPLKEFRPDVPEALERIISRCLAKNREERYPGCRQLRADLERFILSTGKPVGSEQLARLVARLLPPSEQGSEPAESSSPSSKSPAPLAVPRAAATPPPRPGPEAPAAPVPLAKEKSGEKSREKSAERAATPVPPAPPPETRGMETERSLAAPASHEAPENRPEPPESAMEDLARESPPEAAWETGLDATAPLVHPRRHGGRAALLAALVLALVTAAAGAMTRLWPLPAAPHEGPGPSAWAPPVHPPEPPRPPDPAPQPEAPPPPAEPEPVAGPSLADVAPARAEEDTTAPQQLPAEEEAGGATPARDTPTELVRPVAIAKRGGQAKGMKRSPEHKSRGAGAPRDQAGPPVETEAAQPRLASAVFESSPPAQLRVNGQFAGFSPVSLSHLAPGPVQVEAYDSVKGFSKRWTFVLEPGDNGVLRVEVKQASLELRIHPGTEVFLDGKRLGQTPLGPIRLYEGKHGLRLVNEALRKEIITTLRLEPGEVFVFEYDLEKEP